MKQLTTKLGLYKSKTIVHKSNFIGVKNDLIYKIIADNAISKKNVVAPENAAPNNLDLILFIFDC